MQIAVARVENVAHAQPVASANFSHAAQDIGQAGARDNAILHVEFGADAPDSTKSIFAPGPETLAFLFVGGNANRTSVVFLADLHDFLLARPRFLPDPLTPSGAPPQHLTGSPRANRPQLPAESSDPSSRWPRE